MEKSDQPDDHAPDPESDGDRTPLRIWHPDELTAAMDLPADEPVSWKTSSQDEEESATPKRTGFITHPLAGPGLRLASESLDFLLLCSLATLLSWFVELPWVAPPSSPVGVAAVADSVASAVTGSGQGPQAQAAAQDFAVRTTRAWILMVFGAHFVLPLILALTGAARTPGMILLGLRPVSIWTGDTPSGPMLILRALVRVVDALPLFYLGGLLAARFDPLGARRFLSDQMAHSVVLRITPLSDELAALGVPATAYGTHEIGYLVEALLARLPNLHPDQAHALAHRLATLISRAHPEELTPDLQRYLDQNEPLKFLRELARNASR